VQPQQVGESAAQVLFGYAAAVVHAAGAFWLLGTGKTEKPANNTETVLEYQV
jgi:hypothetical protein